MKFFAKTFVVTLLAAVHLCAVAKEAVADTMQLGNITVTAIKQGTTAPATATSTIDRQTSERNQLMGAKTAATLVPNFFIPDYGSRMTSTIYVRGIGTRIDQPTVGMNIDNVPVLCKENYDLDIMDISRIEMLRGPQSTLFGRNTLGGLINIYTLSPWQWQGTRAILSYGSHNALQVGASHYRLINDKVGFSLNAYYTSTDGEFRNTYNGKHIDWERQCNTRLKLEWHPINDLTVSNVAAFSISRQGGYPYEQVGTNQIAYNDTCFYRRTSFTDGLTLNKDWEWGSLASITSYQYLDDNMTLDQDFTTLPYFTLTQARSEHALTHDMVLRSKNGSKYQWLNGLFGFYRTLDMNAPVHFKDTGIAELIEKHVNEAMPTYPVRWNDRTFLLGSDFTMRTWGTALYHQSQLNWNNFTFTAGVRIDYEHANLKYHSNTHTGYSIIETATGNIYSHENIDIDDRGKLNKDFFQILPRLAATYHFSYSNHLYIALTRGSKAGGFNTQMFSDVLQQRLMRLMGIGIAYDVNEIVSYKPEKAWNFELGSHFDLLNDHITLDANVFYMDCRDRQLTIFPPGLTTGRMMTNAGQTRSCGTEVAITVRPTARTTVNLNYGFTHATFKHYNDGKADYSGKYVPYAPSHTLWVEALHEIQLSNDKWARTLVLGANMSGAGRIYWNEANDLYQPFYALLGANISLIGKNYSLQLWGRNLTDTDYRTFYFVSISHEFLQRGHGRSMGVTLRLNIN